MIVKQRRWHAGPKALLKQVDQTNCAQRIQPRVK